jgi:hypothetical protein
MVAVRRQLLSASRSPTSFALYTCNEVAHLTSGQFVRASGPSEAGVGLPKTVKQDGELAGNGDPGALGPFGRRERLALRL